LGLSLLGMAMTVPSAQAATLSFDPIAVNATVGEVFQVGVRVDGLGDGSSPSLSVFDLDLAFDGALLGFEGVGFGALLGDIANFEAVILADGLASPGVLHLAESSLLEENLATCLFCSGPYLEGLQGAGFTLATVSFRALAVGAGPLSLSVNSVGDGAGQPLPIDSLGTASVTAAAAVPEPSAGLLLLFGLPLLRRFRCDRQS
jgi:hypothetical protein